jgi:hypothetical protein
LSHSKSRSHLYIDKDRGEEATHLARLSACSSKLLYPSHPRVYCTFSRLSEAQWEEQGESGVCCNATWQLIETELNLFVVLFHINCFVFICWQCERHSILSMSHTHTHAHDHMHSHYIVVGLTYYHDSCDVRETNAYHLKCAVTTRHYRVF